MGKIYEVEDLGGWFFESRQGCTSITPPHESVIFSDGKRTESIELSNEDMMLLHHVLGEAIKKMRPQ